MYWPHWVGPDIKIKQISSQNHTLFLQRSVRKFNSMANYEQRSLQVQAHIKATYPWCVCTNQCSSWWLYHSYCMSHWPRMFAPKWCRSITGSLLIIETSLYDRWHDTWHLVRILMPMWLHIIWSDNLYSVINAFENFLRRLTFVISLHQLTTPLFRLLDGE